MTQPRQKTPAPSHEDELIEALETAEGIGQSEAPPAIADLLEKGDSEGLIELGAAYRSGAPFVKRDLGKAVECFEAAASLGHSEAEYLVGVMRFSGIGVAKDPNEGAARLRAAAQKGSLRAKVYLANLYEMGVHYAVDKEKADVWYRNVARAANIEEPAAPEGGAASRSGAKGAKAAEPDSEGYEMAMAELGCVRYCLRLVANAHLPAKDRAFYLKKAKAMGYAHRLAQAKRESATPEPPIEPETKIANADPVPEAQKAPEPPKETKETKTEESEALAEQWTILQGIGAFVAASAFAAASFFAAFLSVEGARALHAAGRTLPYLGERFELIGLAIIIALGVAPAGGLYRARVHAIATLVAVATGAGGWLAFDSFRLLWDRASQAGAFGLAAFLVVLLGLGILGGTRAKPPPKKKKLPRASKAPV